MDALLLDPNIAYLFIVIGLVLAVLALLTPGTGFFEIGSFFALAMAGWQVYSLQLNGRPVNLWALLLALVGLAGFVLAIRRTRGQLLFLGGAIIALVIGSAYLFRGEGLLPAVNPWLALVVSTFSTVFLWLVATKTFEAHRRRPSHDLSTLLGAVGVARTDVQADGTVYVNMEDWSAQSAERIPAGDRVRVVGREGLVLIVEPDVQAD